MRRFIVLAALLFSLLLIFGCIKSEPSANTITSPKATLPDAATSSPPPATTEMPSTTTPSTPATPTDTSPTLAASTGATITPPPTTGATSFSLELTQSGGITGKYSRTFKIMGTTLTTSGNGAATSTTKTLSGQQLSEIAALAGKLENITPDSCPDAYNVFVSASVDGRQTKLDAPAMCPDPLVNALTEKLASLASATQECVTAVDCATDGCSGQLCRAKAGEPIITTCEFREEYSCYTQARCGCVQGKCAWNEEATECVSSVRKGGLQELVKTRCTELCKEYAANGTALEDGPCLSNRIADDWVCDVAHYPRQAVDDAKENTCPQFGVTAHHFVEADSSCKPIVVDGKPV